MCPYKSNQSNSGVTKNDHIIVFMLLAVNQMSFEAAILKFYLELKRYAEADLELLQHPRWRTWWL